MIGELNFWIFERTENEERYFENVILFHSLHGNEMNIT